MLSWARCFGSVMICSRVSATPRTQATRRSSQRRAPCRSPAEALGRAPVVSASSSPLLRRYAHRLRMRVRRILVDAPFDLGTEMAQQPLHRPGGAVAERADGVAFDLLRHLHQHVD